MAKTLLILCAVFTSISSFSQIANVTQGEYVKAQASAQYDKPSFLQKILMGTNYRREWATPVEMPVFRLREMGFDILELGGGMQTKSLRLKDKTGTQWVLRRVEKDVGPNLPKNLQNTIAERTVQDMVSAAHPYAPLTIAPLANALGIIVPEPRLYYVAAGADLGQYAPIFANSVCFLEEREPTVDKSDTKGTEKMLEEILEENDHLVIQQAVLKARLLDMLVGDWDRHADQWRWGILDSADVKYYYAIPRDRDQAYFYSNGLLPKIAQFVAMRHLISFKNNLSKLNDLNFKAWYFDGIFCNELDAKQWETTILALQKRLTDQVIHEAIKKLPPEVYPISGPVIEMKLKGRRDKLLKAGMEYYQFLANSVNITGTDNAELFIISGDLEKLLITVYDQKDNKKGRKIYERSFIESETDLITLIGMGGNDQFMVQEETQSQIRLKILGGKGADIYSMKGKVKNTIYEDPSDGNKMESITYSRIKKIAH